MLFNKFICALLTISMLTSCGVSKIDDTKGALANPLLQSKNHQDVSKLSVNMPQQKLQTDDLNDGPFVFKNTDDLSALWLCNGEEISLSVDKLALPFSLPYCDKTVTLDRIDFSEQSILEYQGDFAVAASSDFHGQYELMLALLKNNNIIDQQGDWSFGDGHFVITGDVFDRGDKVTEILWFLYRLEQQAEQADGKLHLLLGNHEVMVLNGDLRYIHPKYVEVSKRLKVSYDQLYGQGTVLGDWLRTKPVLVKVNNMLFAHGGFHPSLAKEKRSLKAINQVFKQNLVKAEISMPREGWGDYLHKSNGPIWYRGYFKDAITDNGASSEEIDLLLKHFDIAHLVVGHTSQKQVETRYQGRVIAIDSSIKNAEYGEVLLIKGKERWRGTLSGNKITLK